MPCREAAPSLERIWTKNQSRGLMVIGCHSRVGSPPPNGLANAIKEMKLTFPCGLDTGRDVTQGRFGVRMRPHLTLIGYDGRVAWQGDPRDAEFESELEMAITQIPEPIRYVTEDQSSVVKPFAEAAAAGDFSKAIKGLGKLIDKGDMEEEVADQVSDLLERIAEKAERVMEAIEDLEGKQFYFESDELMAANKWLRDVDAFREQLDEWIGDRDEETLAEALTAAKHYHQGLALLRKGDTEKAKAEFTIVFENYGATSYGELALLKISQLK